MLINYISNYFTICWAFQLVLVIKNLPDNPEEVRDVGSIPGSRRPPGGGHGNPYQYPYLENPIDRRVWQGIVHTVTNSRAWLKRQHACIQLLDKKLKTVILSLWWYYVEVQFSSVVQSCLTLCNTMNCSTTGLPAHHKLPEFTQTHVNKSVMPSSHLILCHPLLLLPQSLPASGSFPMSQLFAWGGQSIGVSASTSVLSMNTQDGSPLGWTGWISLQSKDS